jgi:hypothetical protein
MIFQRKDYIRSKICIYDSYPSSSMIPPQFFALRGIFQQLQYAQK